MRTRVCTNFQNEGAISGSPDMQKGTSRGFACVFRLDAGLVYLTDCAEYPLR